MEEIKVYNTLKREKQILKPIEEGKVKIYVCGVTPYNHPHIGNARPAVTWDIIRRYLEYIGYHVDFIQNFTDVDDKIINKANAEKSDWKTVSTRYIDAYFKVMDALHIRRADIYPYVSKHMGDIIDMVKTLIEKGHAYVLGNDVYYDISTFKDYCKLSGRKVEDMLAGARVMVNTAKRNPGDFALWKGAKPGEPFWESPWGNGRPGWHIECSVMSTHYLGATFDFHGGGSDLIFPHHENEIAQSEGATGQKFVKYWLHNGFITINSEKMSKSLNNFFLVKDVLEKYSGDALRYFLLSTHYRSPLDFSDERLEEAEKNMSKLKDVIARIKEMEKEDGKVETNESVSLKKAAARTIEEFRQAMNDDFNTGLATGVLFDFVKDINIYYNAVNSGVAIDKEAVIEAKETFKTILDILGILENEWNIQESHAGSDYDALMEMILSVREIARKEKQYKLADEIRDKLAELGITVEDSATGARWKKRGV
ncbi:cysteine--tRNA ligase [Dialister micraerophilus]|uniref:Cysteine--tRNA ligase n=1 Tax=Dialister micraerophilus UPII 345-E TaxID=910314 RepID=E4L8L3_9FIRM|nr:cysteine--tRNA ligase [Dialister micraerophilus]EFR42855.1 cysteine--tRNA ligase [Dialister micraerophilus UPII 345-E]